MTTGRADGEGNRPLEPPARTAEVVRHGIAMRFEIPALDVVPYVVQPVLHGGYYEQKMLDHIRSLGLRGAYVDVGAHLGTHSLWFALQCPATQVYSFEPVSRFAEMLRRNVALNAASQRIKVLQVGLSDRVGATDVLLPSSHQQGFMPDPTDLIENFPVTRLDDVIDDDIVVIKMDVEGMEPDVLRGAKRILEECSPVVFAEARDAGEQRALIAELSLHGYLPTGRVFNATPTFEFRKPTRPWHRALWAFRMVRTAREHA